MQSGNEIKVWDWVVRGFHWATVLLCVLNLFIPRGGERNHRYAGYALAGLLVLRILWSSSALTMPGLPSGCRRRLASSPISRAPCRTASYYAGHAIRWAP